jgi:membrane protease YdiL (CAAX protease family)
MSNRSATVEGAGHRVSQRRMLGSLLVMGVLQLPLAGMLFAGKGLIPQIDRELVYWCSALLLLLYIVRIEQRPLRSIGLTWPTGKSVGAGILGAAVMIAGMALIYLVIFPAFGLSDAAQNAAAEDEPFGLLFLVVIRAAVYEELFYRGFAIERLAEMTGLRWLAGLISVVAFTYAHLSYWGWAHLIVAGYGGLVLTVMYVWRRDLASNMIAHFLTDAVGFLLGAV